MNYNTYTHTLFESDKCNYITVNDHRSVMCNGNVGIGDILLIEHCHGQKFEDQNILKHSIKIDRILFNSLYPRTIKWNESYALGSTVPPEVESLVCEKLQNNAFHRDGLCIIGNDISRFNHSNKPNAYVVTTTVDVCVNQTLIILTVVAGTEINKGDEILIKYNDVVTYDKNISIGESRRFTITNSKIIKDMLKQYLRNYIGTKEYYAVIFKQICSCYGLYLVDDIISQTTRFTKYMESQPYYDKDNQLECIVKWMSITEGDLHNSNVYEYI